MHVAKDATLHDLRALIREQFDETIISQEYHFKVGGHLIFEQQEKRYSLADIGMITNNNQQHQQQSKEIVLLEKSTHNFTSPPPAKRAKVDHESDGSGTAAVAVTTTGEEMEENPDDLNSSQDGDEQRVSNSGTDSSKPTDKKDRKSENEGEREETQDQDVQQEVDNDDDYIEREDPGATINEQLDEANNNELNEDVKQPLKPYKVEPYELSEERMLLLKRYKEREGHCEVPYTYKEDGTFLGIWVDCLRRNKKLTKDQRRRLDELGMVWNPDVKAFDGWFSLLQQFKDREGHCRVPRKHEEDGKKLGMWLYKHTQRKDRRCQLTNQQLLQLHKMGVAEGKAGKQ